MKMTGENLKANVVVSSFETEYEFAIKEETTGRQLLDTVACQLGLEEICFFGLSYINRGGQDTWLRLKKKVFSQDVGKKRPIFLKFLVKFYPEDIAKEVHNDITKKLFYLQVKQAILGGTLYCPPDIAVVLASYISQIKLGDYNPVIHRPGFTNEFSLLPDNVPHDQEWEDKVVHYYQEHNGMSREQAIMEYLLVAQDLDMYGVNYFEIKDKKGTAYYLGVDALGLNIYEKEKRLTPTFSFGWSIINSLSFKGRKFGISISDTEKQYLSFSVLHSCTNMTILGLCIGNHELYTRRHGANKEKQTTFVPNEASTLPREMCTFRNVSRDVLKEQFHVEKSAEITSTQGDNNENRTSDGDSELTAQQVEGTPEFHSQMKQDSKHQSTEPTLDHLHEFQAGARSRDHDKDKPGMEAIVTKDKTHTDGNTTTKSDDENKVPEQNGVISETQSLIPPVLTNSENLEMTSTNVDVHNSDMSEDTEIIRYLKRHSGAVSAMVADFKMKEVTTSDVKCELSSAPQCEKERGEITLDYLATLQSDPEEHQPNPEVERLLQSEENKQIYKKLKDCFENLSTEEREAISTDEQLFQKLQTKVHYGKYKTLKGIRRGNIKEKLDMFESI